MKADEHEDHVQTRIQLAVMQNDLENLKSDMSSLKEDLKEMKGYFFKAMWVAAGSIILQVTKFMLEGGFSLV